MYGWRFLRVVFVGGYFIGWFCATLNTIKINTLKYINYRARLRKCRMTSCFLNVKHFNYVWCLVSKKIPFKFLQFEPSKYLNIISFGTQTLSANKLQRVSFKLFQFKKVLIWPYKKKSGTFRHIHSILNVLVIWLTPPLLIMEKLSTFHKHSNGKYFLDILLISLCMKRRIF